MSKLFIDPGVPHSVIYTFNWVIVQVVRFICRTGAVTELESILWQLKLDGMETISLLQYITYNTIKETLNKKS